ncbi:multicopper oxidase family protein [Parachitinimonas caeni]|uniref:Multicopper oxidase family protein n=1 Tax=Parachitinimonas caeni TaxID=3031301 RepID=A0ABT7DVV9_9NEIS|nr:multicopper oxidase family protein [Parachitinimonas caeni]MDK2124201.1 multicopper oxidase family protein [Parachitinimonas caeni]
MNRRNFLLSGLALACAQAFGMEMDHHAKLVIKGGNAFVPPANIRLPVGQPLRALPRLANQTKEAGVFKAKLVAAPATLELVRGHKTQAWAYNGQLPGPAIEIAAGSRVEIEFENHLPQATTVHWHGLPVPADQDGSPHDAVQPGGSRLYQFTLPADFSGTFWYHPHPHDDTAEQVFRGLAGAFVVRDPKDPLAHLPEQWLLISDLRLDKSAQIPANTLADWADGREGQFVLINGQWRPAVAMAPGSLNRIRIWNACSARYLRLALPGARLFVVGTDGGLIAAPYEVREWLLAPAQRVELLIEMPMAAKGNKLTLLAEPYKRGRMATPEQKRALPLADVVLTGEKVATPAMPEKLREIPPLPEPTSSKRIVFSEEMGEVRSPKDFGFLINSKRYEHDRIDFVSVVGETELWEVINGSNMDHPFHLHGVQFQVVATVRQGDAISPPFLSWQDTINVAHAERVRLKVRQDHPGLRMLHCHILEHESLGMMANLMVNAAPTPA